jgi:carboxyl-terminal processing protease
MYLIRKVHYQPPAFDELFQIRVLNNYLFAIDPQCLYLYKRDIAELTGIKASTPSEVFCRYHAFLSHIYKARVNETDSILAASGWPHWIMNDSLQINNSFCNRYPAEVTSKVGKINQWLRLYTLKEAGDSLTRGSYLFTKDAAIHKTSVKELRKMLLRERSSPERIDAFLAGNLLNAIASACDPHSDYFTGQQKNQFSDALSSTVKRYGLSFTENKSGRIEISGIKPGTPAWKSNRLNVGDIIAKVRFGHRRIVDVSAYDMNEFNELLAQSVEQEMDLHVLKKGGEMVEVRLAKATIKSDENVINSYVLSDGFPVGYISLPAFYTDFTDGSAMGSANDVARELVRLRTDSIKALILDLRNNGGGSVAEAIHLAGIFIDAGPLFIERVVSKKPRVIKDVNRGAIYTGPLIVLINENSASASELLALALKSHERAVVVGSRSWGKATEQVVLPLDTSFDLYNDRRKYNESNGYVKLTVGKLYDLSGGTYQREGVAPQVAIPDPWAPVPQGEDSYEHALNNDIIDKKVFVETSPDPNIGTCASLSAERMRADEGFKAVTDNCRRRNTLWASATLPLHPVQYRQFVTTLHALDSVIDAVCTPDTNIHVRASHTNNYLAKIDEELQGLIEDEIQELKKDIILRETYHIVKDLYSN